MLKKLRNKIVLTNMILVGVLLIAVSIAVCVIVWRRGSREVDERLDFALNMVSGKSGDFSEEKPPQLISEDFGGMPFPFFGNGSGKERKIDGSAVAVLVDADGNVLGKSEWNATMDDESVAYALNAIGSSEKTSGMIPEFGIRYKTRSAPSGTAVAFTDLTNLASDMRSAVLIAAIVDIGVLIVIFFISLGLASLSLKPVKEAWDNEKRFIADASHELKTPLTVILANNNIMESNNRDGGQAQWLESTRYEAERMQKLIEEMLFLAKSDEGGYKLAMSDVSVSDIAERCCLSFEPVAFEKGVTIDTDITPGITVLSDGTMLERIFGVLIDNAVKHSFKDSSVKVSLLKENKNVCVSVNNTGSVIPKEDLPHIFERFYKADKSRRNDSATGGFGLGLSIAADIAEKLGGAITASSSEEEGTTFRFTVPAQ